MAQSGRRGMADAQKTELWHRWRKGEPIHEINRAIGERRSAIYTVLYRHGGFTPPERRRSSHALTLAEREEVS